jgi:hypothetical protein
MIPRSGFRRRDRIEFLCHQGTRRLLSSLFEQASVANSGALAAEGQIMRISGMLFVIAVGALMPSGHAHHSRADLVAAE